MNPTGGSTTAMAVSASLQPEQRAAFFATYNSRAKDENTALLLTFFLGGLGAHRFYLNQTGSALIYLFFCWTFIPALIAFFELFTIKSRVREFNSDLANQVAAEVTGGFGQFIASPGNTDSRAGRPPSRVTEQWAPDPYGKFLQRFFDGSTWTSHVSNGDGETVSDKPEFDPPEDGPGWHSDPFERYKHRYFDGVVWTSSISVGDGATGDDLATFEPPRSAAPSPPPPPTIEDSQKNDTGFGGTDVDEA